MSKRIFYIGLWHLFNSNDNWFNEVLFKYCKTKIIVVDNIDDCDIIVIGNFINSNDYNIISSYGKPKIYLITEPVGKWFDIGTRLLRDNTYDCLAGCVTDDTKNIPRIKCPLYIPTICADDYDITKNILEKTNEYVRDCARNCAREPYLNKRFCCLINRHDAGNTRKSIAIEMHKISQIHCPSVLFNNCSNEELERLGNIEYIKNYLYNICPENFNNCEFDGYITEKLMNACLAGAIPIYTGSFDEVDARIFNPKRILFYDPNNPETIDKIVKTVKLFETNPDLLKYFYSQPVFLPTAADALEEMRKNFAGWFDTIKII